MISMREGSDKNGFFQKTTLKNGLRVITEKIPSVRSISIGVWIDVGSRNEKPSENGLSHFIEHLVFKGTRKRTAKQIASSLESIGGSLNGFTSREHTCFTARVLDFYLDEAIDVLADMACNASFTPVNIKREGLVICEEIKEVLDNPADYIHDLFSETFWGKHPLGQPIMGAPENITGMTRSKMLNFLKKHYRNESVVIAVSGSVSHAKLVRLVKEKFHFEDGPVEPPDIPIRTRERAVKIVKDNNQQTHYCIGFPGVAYTNPEKFTVMSLNSYLGGGMSSVLFQKIREEKGLA
ncbi:MAG: M16 family metallopeptidase, partial [Candidatus Zixiibacteriota bacterium]